MWTTAIEAHAWRMRARSFRSKVIQMLAEGPGTLRELAIEANVGYRAMSRTLRALHDRGQIRRIALIKGQAVYELVYKVEVPVNIRRRSGMMDETIGGGEMNVKIRNTVTSRQSAVTQAKGIKNAVNKPKPASLAKVKGSVNSPRSAK